MIIQNEIGRRIQDARKSEKQTQDQFGRRYDISGPAVFKFEKGKVKPSLDLWLRMAKDMGLTEARAVLIWVREKLPERFRDYVDLNAVAEEEMTYEAKTKNEYLKAKDAKQLRKVVAADPNLPSALKDMLDDQELWALYKPSGYEVHTLSRLFGPLGHGSKELYREALRLVREFTRN